MSNAIILRDKERETVINFHNRNIERVKEQIIDLQAELSDSYDRFTELTGKVHPDLIKSATEQIEQAFSLYYRENMPLWEKVKFTLSTTNRLSSTRQIAEFINQQEGGNKNLPEIISAIGATLKPKVDKGIVFDRFETKSGEYYYGLVEWFRIKGIPKQEYIKKATD